jgi:hypothetical protein
MREDRGVLVGCVMSILVVGFALGLIVGVVLW